MEVAKKSLGYLKDLNADDFATRQRATDALIGLGPRALPHLRKAVKEADNAEVAARLQQVVTGIGGLRIDDARSAVPVPGLKRNSGLIGVQNHGDPVSFRNIRISEVKAGSKEKNNKK